MKTKKGLTYPQGVLNSLRLEQLDFSAYTFYLLPCCIKNSKLVLFLKKEGFLMFSGK